MAKLIEPFPELLNAVSQVFPIGQSLAGEMSVTGLPYADLTVDVSRREQALDAGKQLFDRYALHRTGVVYFGAYPKVEKVRVGRQYVFRVSLRVLITDNPVISRLAAEALSA